MPTRCFCDEGTLVRRAANSGVLMIALLAQGLDGQQAVAPTPAPGGRNLGEDHRGFNIVHSFETGYRFRSVGGSEGRYRSDVNYQDGVRLLGSSLGVYSKEGHGRLFDELVLTTQGLGNDPYQAATLRVQKNRLYRYDLLWRLNEYYNPALAIAGGQHLADTRRRLQDHDFTLFPQSSFRLFAGYGRNSQDGPALSTIQVFDSRGDEFPFFAGVRRVQSEYRLGAQARLRGLQWTVVRAWENFTEDTPFLLAAPAAGNNAADQTTLASFRRTEPYHGNTPGWRVNLFTEQKNWFAVNGRFTWAGGRRDFVLDETATGTDRFGGARNRQIVVAGTGRRPVGAAHLTFSVFPTDRLTLTNHTAFHQTRMENRSAYVEFNNATRGFQETRFDFLGIRTATNATDVNWRAMNWLGLRGGYHYSTRRIRSREGFGFEGQFDPSPVHEQNNRLHSGIWGVRLQPRKPLSIGLDAEIGRADRPFYPTSERDYHALGGRVEYKSRSLLVSAAARSAYNTNSTALFQHSARSRTWALDGSWTGRAWLALDAGYSKLHLDALTGIAYFAAFNLVEGDRALYRSNVHAANLGVRLAIGNRADLYLGYSRVEDAGDGRASPELPAAGRPAVTRLSPLAAVETYPLAFESPLARLSVRLYARLRWNVGYQFYRYREDLLAAQNYRAHTGFASVVWSF